MATVNTVDYRAELLAAQAGLDRIRAEEVDYLRRRGAAIVGLMADGVSLADVGAMLGGVSRQNVHKMKTMGR